MLIVMEKPIQEENLSQPLQTNIIQYEIAVSFLTRCNGIFTIKNKNSFYHNGN